MNVLENLENLRHWHIDDMCTLRDAKISKICGTGASTICVRSEMRSWRKFSNTSRISFSALRCCTRSRRTNLPPRLSPRRSSAAFVDAGPTCPPRPVSSLNLLGGPLLHWLISGISPIPLDRLLLRDGHLLDLRYGHNDLLPRSPPCAPHQRGRHLADSRSSISSKDPPQHRHSDAGRGTDLCGAMGTARHASTKELCQHQLRPLQKRTNQDKFTTAPRTTLSHT